MKKKIFISGRITGLDISDARRKFNEDERRLRGFGYEVVNPMNITGSAGESWRECMIDCIEELFFCDEIYMQPDWGQSKGARLEHSIARDLGLKINYCTVEKC